MDKLYDDEYDEEGEDEFPEHEVFSPVQLLLFFALALPSTVALQALGLGWDAAVACITASGLAAAFGPHLYRAAKEHGPWLAGGSSRWQGLLLPAPAGETDEEETVEGSLQDSTQHRWQADDDEDEEETEENWPEEETLYAPSSFSSASASRLAPGTNWQQAQQRMGTWGARWSDHPRDEHEDLLDLAPTLVVHPDTIFSGRVLVAGLPGSGKSNTMRRMIEECGRLGLPFLLIDTDGEYVSLLPYLRNGVLVGATNRMRIPASHFAAIDRADALNFGKLLLSENLQAIFDVKSYTEYHGRPDENTAALVFMDIVYGMRAWQEARPSTERIPSMIFLEEAQVWLPQQPTSSTLNRSTLRDLQALFFRSARDGRRRGIGLVIIAHRIAGIHKEVLSCDWMILHQPQATDLKRYLDLVPSVPRERFQRLVRGRAVVVSPTGTRDVTFHRARSQDNGVTPGLSALHRYQEQAAPSRLPVSHAPMQQEDRGSVRLPETWTNRERLYRPMGRPEHTEETIHVQRPIRALSDLTRDTLGGEEEALALSLPFPSAKDAPTGKMMPVLSQELKQALQAWNNGSTSVVKLQEALGIKHGHAYKLYKELKERRLI